MEIEVDKVTFITENGKYKISIEDHGDYSIIDVIDTTCIEGVNQRRLHTNFFMREPKE